LLSLLLFKFLDQVNAFTQNSSIHLTAKAAGDHFPCSAQKFGIPFCSRLAAQNLSASSILRQLPL
jgi:hypothetical protein